MVTCPSCGAEVRGQKRFCGVCGKPVGEAGSTPGPSSGTSSVKLDADGINMVLRELSTPTREMSFDGGRLVVSQAGLQAVLGGVQLGTSNFDAKVTWTGPVGALNISLEQVQLDQQGLEIRIKLSR